jgi:hypothetical protein
MSDLRELQRWPNAKKKVNASKRTVYLQIAQMARQYYKPNRPCGGALQMRALTPMRRSGSAVQLLKRQLLKRL